MPELPELEVVREVLERRLAGHPIREVTLAPRGGPLVARDLTGGNFRDGLIGAAFSAVARRGKFLIFPMSASRAQARPQGDEVPQVLNASGAQANSHQGELPAPTLLLVANPKLTGRFQLCAPGAKKAGPVHVTFRFDQLDDELRYVDQKRMGQLYLTRALNEVPTFSEMGPDALSVGEAEFRQRLHKFRGEIKGVLARERFLAGIGNAYADEILWQARIHPYRKRTDLSEAETGELYQAMRTTLTESIEQVRHAMGEDIHLKPRDFFAVHMRAGEACPRCGGRVSQITAGNRITNFCRSCQPGGLIRGM